MPRPKKISHRRRRARGNAPTRTAHAFVEDIAVRGDGIAIVQGASVYIPYTAPGDRILAEVRGERGRVKQILSASPNRRTPPCRYFGSCGGCALQHVNDDFYAAWKRGVVVEALDRAGLNDVEIAPLQRVDPAARRRAAFAVQRTGGDLKFGFNERASSHIVDIDDCLILAPALATVLPALKNLAAEIPGAGPFDLAVTLCDNGLDINCVGRRLHESTGAALSQLIAVAKRAGVVRLSVNGETQVMFEPPYIRFSGVRATPPPGGFLQATTPSEEELVMRAAAALEGAKNIVDLFSGSGAFTFALARAAHVHAVDGDKGAIDALSAAAADAQRGGQKLKPVASEVRDLFERPMQDDDLRDFDGAVFDPPRAGARAQAEALARSRIPVIVAVSCNPATFARDARLLVDGGYTLSQVVPVDQFVYSSHIELLGVFRRTKT